MYGQTINPPLTPGSHSLSFWIFITVTTYVRVSLGTPPSAICLYYFNGCVQGLTQAWDFLLHA